MLKVQSDLAEVEDTMTGDPTRRWSASVRESKGLTVRWLVGDLQHRCSELGIWGRLSRRLGESRPSQEVMDPSRQQTELTDEDVTTIRKCRQLSFWRGSVPFTIGSVLMVSVAQKFGYFANRPKLRVPSYILAVIFGYFGGKVSYLGECKRMFLELEDSRIKDYILESKQLPSFGPTSDSPVIINTPVVPSPSDASRPMSYAERREYFRNRPRTTAPPATVETPSHEQEPNEETPPRLPMFDTDRPSSSYQFDDTYKPRD
ncbi:unnamed protein product [Calicophoron daubneyi]|uniref:OCIA domain-containing protein n=1 Tax=Calicophoron daubneyi TaxID=300641 RepID=A0AAV2TRL4_CALDB